MKIIHNRRSWGGCTLLLDILSPEILHLIIQKCSLTENELLELWKAFRKVTPDSVSHKTKEVMSKLGLQRWIEIKLTLFSKINVLDVGCGTGQTISKLTDDYGEQLSAFGVDLVVDETTLHNPRVKIVQANIMSGLPFPDNFFDLMYAWQVLRYISDKNKLVLVLKDLLRILKSAGVFVFDDVKNPFEWYDENVYPHIADQCFFKKDKESRYFIKK
ncbi:MAG TPA: class I SAM-dependent methyltransferase [Candidatus Nanoarchaeia archaeon]|nr:class I SAM-dependent methyltransferase [Candidatus Nanoarchaeia archaeon]